MDDLNMDELYEGMDLEDDTPSGAYGVGKHPEAALEDVVDIGNNEYGYSIDLKFDLAGIGGGRPFKTRLFLPHTNGDEKRTRMAQDQVSSIAHAGGLFVVQGKNKKVPLVDDEDTYRKVLGVFQSAIGRTFPLNVSARKNDPSKVNVWGMKASK